MHVSAVLEVVVSLVLKLRKHIIVYVSSCATFVSHTSFPLFTFQVEKSRKCTYILPYLGQLDHALYAVWLNQPGVE